MIETWSRGDPADSMDESILVGLAARVRRHPWWRARARLTARLLRESGIVPPGRVLDAGCGWGATLVHLEHRGYAVTGIDVARGALDALDRPDRRLIEADLTQPFPTGVPSFDAVLALDVIEHLDDDRGAVARLGGLLRERGVMVVSVPARPDLWSEFDAIQGHRRRYLPARLEAAFDASGLHVERLFWWGRWLAPMVRRQRSRPRGAPGESAVATYARYLRLPPTPIRQALAVAFAIEEPIAARGWLAAGTSLFAIARKP